LAGWFKARYPLLADIAIGDMLEGAAALPPLVGLINAVAEAERASYCFILPRKGDVARIASIAMALTSLQRDYSALARASMAPVNPGEHVRVHPGKHVFRFVGEASEYPEHFWLECKDGSRRTFPRSQAFRLQPVGNRKLTGKGGEPIISAPPHAIDALLGLETYGNLSHIPTSVLLLDVQAHYRKFAERISVGRLSRKTTALTIDRLEIAGEVQDDGSVTGVNGNQGFPLVAVTSSVDALVSAVNRMAPSPTVVVNDLALLRSPQHFDSLAEKSGMLVFADHSEHEKVNELRARGCKIWPIGCAETATDQSRTPAGPLRDVEQAARNSNADIERAEVPHELLEAACNELQALGSALSSFEQHRRQVVGPLFGLLTRMAAVLNEPGDPERSAWHASIRSVREELARIGHWIARDDVHRLEKACETFDRLAIAGGLGAGKSERLAAILQQLKQNGSARVAVIARRGAGAEHIKLLASDAGLEVEVFSGEPALMPHAFFDGLVFTSWIGSAKFEKVVYTYMAPRVFVLGYPFELRWLSQRLVAMRRERSGAVVSDADRGRLIGLDRASSMRWTGAPSEEEPAADDGAAGAFLDVEGMFGSMRRGSGIAQFDTEEKVQAKYVEFAGGRFAFISEGHSLPVATELVVDESRAPTKLPERDVNEWLVGDYIVFLEGGGAQVIRGIADRMLGPRAAQLRGTAIRWRNALISTQLGAAEIQRRLALAGCVRTVTTVRGWLSNSSRIGPEFRSDLEAIAAVTGVRALAASIDVVWAAIQELWSAHLSAGSVLRRILVQKLPHLVEELEESGTEITIEDGGKHLGRALIVKVESIANTFEPCSRSLVNRLRRDSDAFVDTAGRDSTFEDVLASLDNLSESQRAELLRNLERP
jgi:hypothetical protein